MGPPSSTLPFFTHMLFFQAHLISGSLDFKSYMSAWSSKKSKRNLIALGALSTERMVWNMLSTYSWMTLCCRGIQGIKRQIFIVMTDWSNLSCCMVINIFRIGFWWYMLHCLPLWTPGSNPRGSLVFGWGFQSLCLVVCDFPQLGFSSHI